METRLEKTSIVKLFAFTTFVLTPVAFVVVGIAMLLWRAVT